MMESPLEESSLPVPLPLPTEARSPTPQPPSPVQLMKELTKEIEAMDAELLTIEAGSSHIVPMIIGST
jgi:hypothetical protein